MTNKEAKERMIRKLTGQCVVVISDRTHVLRLEWVQNTGIVYPTRLKSAQELFEFFNAKQSKVLSFKKRRKPISREPMTIRWAP